MKLKIEFDIESQINDYSFEELEDFKDNLIRLIRYTILNEVEEAIIILKSDVKEIN